MRMSWNTRNGNEAGTGTEGNGINRNTMRQERKKTGIRWNNRNGNEAGMGRKSHEEEW